MAYSQELSTRQINQLKTEFLALDENKDGRISTSELRKLIVGVQKKLNISEKDIDRIMGTFDSPGKFTDTI